MFADLQLQGVGPAGTGQIIIWLIAETWIWTQIGDDEDMNLDDYFRAGESPESSVISGAGLTFCIRFVTPFVNCKA